MNYLLITEAEINNQSLQGWKIFDKLELIEQPIEDAWGYHICKV